MRLSEIAEITGGRIVGNPDIEINGASGLKEAEDGDITFLADKRNLDHVFSTRASAVIVKEEIKGLSKVMLVVDNPYLAFAKALEVLYKKPHHARGVSDKAIIEEDVIIGKDVTIHPFVYIGNKGVIGDRVCIYPNVYIGDGVRIDDDTIIYPNVTIREDVKIGKRVIIHPGTVIGADGFGYVQEEGRHYKIPQVGSVIIEDDVEIGANVTIDRATTGKTIIGAGTKIDNLVQIGHNVKIGKNCIIVAQVGIGGSSEIGDGTIIAGQAGIRDHVRLGKMVRVGAKAGVTHDIPDGEEVSGYPAISHKEWLRAQSIYSRLHEYIRRLQRLERVAVKKLESL
ncbi:MAG: UDP-3-O-(3-hydroxymyristoyl)glucosamine N-acyltransferase [Thermodesulfovibrionia bacterium]